MAGATRSSDNGPIVEINVIPLVDIVLVILIIFMVAAPLVMKPKIDINLPKAATAKDAKEKGPMHVVLGKKGEVFLDNNAVTLEGLTEQAKRRSAAQPDAAALLVADKEATLSMLTEVVDAVKLGGVEKVAFSIERKK